MLGNIIIFYEIQQVALKGTSPYNELNIECVVCHVTGNIIPFAGSLQPTEA